MTGKRGPQVEKLLLEGALPQDVDRVMEGYGMAMGPLATGDLAGLDIGAAVRKARGTVAPIADAIVAKGRFGQKTGAGYYRYDENRKRQPDPEVERIILDVAEKMQVRRRKIEDAEILERLLLPMVNEGARILEEGIAARPVDIDVVFTSGFGWPAWRGGPMFWADSIGLKQVRDKLAHYAEATNDPNLRPAPLIERLAAENGSFAEIAFRKEVRDFIARELPAETRERMAAGKGPTKDMVVDWQRKLNAKGWAVPEWPPEWGGPKDWTLGMRHIFREELQLAPAPQPLAFNTNMCGPVIVAFGTEEQKKRFLPRMANLDDWWCQGFSEPGAGSDLASLKTRAVREGDH